MQVRAGGASVIETVLKCDTERSDLIAEEAKLMRILNPEPEAVPLSHHKTNGKHAATTPAEMPQPDPAAATRLEEVISTLLACAPFFKSFQRNTIKPTILNFSLLLNKLIEFVC